MTDPPESETPRGNRGVLKAFFVDSGPTDEIGECFLMYPWNFKTWGSSGGLFPSGPADSETVQGFLTMPSAIAQRRLDGAPWKGICIP